MEARLEIWRRRAKPKKTYASTRLCILESIAWKTRWTRTTTCHFCSGLPCVEHRRATAAIPTRLIVSCLGRSIGYAFWKKLLNILKLFSIFFPYISYGKCSTFQIFIPKSDSQMMCHHLMKWWHISQNDKSHEIVTHHLGTKFWEKNLGCVALPISYCRS
jgi:hypothetical protein